MSSNVIDFPGTPSDVPDEPDSGPEALEGTVVPEPETVKGKGGERKPIVPVPLQRENIKATARYHGGLNWHRARYHGLRTPLYLPLGLFWAVVGVLRLAGAQLSWAFDARSTFLAAEEVGRSDTRAYLTVSRHADDHRRVRVPVLIAEAVAIIGACLWLSLAAPLVVALLVLVAVLPVLAHLGRPVNKPIVQSAVVPPVYTAPTPVVIEKALGSMSIPRLAAALKDDGHLTFVTDVHRDGAGWGVQFDAPHGVTAEMILGKRDELASGLRRPLSAVWPAGVPQEHPGRVDLWIGFQDASKVAPVPYPHIKSGTPDVFGPVPFGSDPRQRPVAAGLFELNWLIGAAPGQGKSNAIRVLAASGALDVVADIWTHEFSGKGDLEPLSLISHRYVGGLDDDSVAYGAQSLTMLRAELERRSGVFKKIPRKHRPDGKLTRDLAAKKANKLRPIVAIFDEVQNLFMHPRFGKQAGDDAAYLIRLGRAYGLIVILATQRPDRDSLPPAVSGIVTARYCLHVPDQVSNDMILGTSSYSAGYNATLFRPKIDRGWGWLKADGQPATARTYYLDLDDFQKVCQRARVLREGAGVLTGYALGESDGQPSRDVMADVLACFGPDESGLHWTVLSQRLGDRFQARWTGATPDSVSAEVRSHGVPSVVVTAEGERARGCRRRDVERAGESR